MIALGLAQRLLALGHEQLMTALKLSEQDAFRRLQLTARERNLQLAEVARRVVEQQSLLEPKRRSSSSANPRL